MVTIEFHETLSHVLTQEGAQISLEGSHEARVWGALPKKGEGTPLTVQQLQEAVGKESASVGQGRAFKAKWIGKEGNGFVKLVFLITRREGSRLFTFANLTKGRLYRRQDAVRTPGSRLYRNAQGGREGVG